MTFIPNPAAKQTLKRIAKLEEKLDRVDRKSKVFEIREKGQIQAQINREVSIAITGENWVDFIPTVKGGYTPTVDADYHGAELATRFEYMFFQTFGRRAHVKSRKPSIV